MGIRADLECCTRCPPKVAGLHIGIRKLASAALDEEMPWRALIFEVGTCAGRKRVMGRTSDIDRASSFRDGTAVAGNGALPYHLVLH